MWILEDGISLNTVAGTGTIKVLLESVNEIPDKYDELEELFPDVTFVGSGWYVLDVNVSDGVFLEADISVVNNDGAGLDNSGNAISQYSESFSQYDIEPIVSSTTGLKNWKNWFKNQNWFSESDDDPGAGAKMSQTISFESGQFYSSWMNAVNPAMPAGVLLSGDQRLCVDLNITRNADQRGRGKWQTTATFWIAPGALQWRTDL